MGVEQWPLVLAGPIVRRVEPGLVAIWVALKEERVVRVRVYEGPIDAGSGTDVFDRTTSVASGDARTMRVGEHLHVACTIATTAAGATMTAGQTYAYDVLLGPPTEPFTPSEDLKSLGLLQDRTATTGEGARPRHAALGYEPGALPTFVLPPAELKDLRIAHGSCRRIHADCFDMIASLDGVIGDGRTQIANRPQQLFLTGDQIYADDVAAGVLHVLTPLGNELLGVVEQLPTTTTVQPSQGVRLWPADRRHFPAGLRKAVVRTDALLTTDDGESHLLSFGEYLAMHLLSYSNELWPATLPAFGDVFWAESLPLGENDGVLAGVDLPPDIWRTHLGLGGELGLLDHGAAKDHLPAGTPPAFTATTVAAVLKAIAADEELRDAHDAATKVVAAFRESLPEARRAMANIATYMICDDHEITDDWNLSRRWKDRVYRSPLGSTTLRNGILGYFVCQGWGNDPVATGKAGSKSRELMDALPGLFVAGDAVAPVKTVANQIDVLLGLDGNDPPVRWHYTVDGPKHRVLVLDTRSRRSFRDRVAPPTNLSEAAMKEQIPDGPLPPGREVLFVIAPLPVFGMPLSDELAGPLVYRAFDALKSSDIEGMPGTSPDAAEAWNNDPEAFEALLARLAVYRKVVVLSGDVHYAYSGEASYWTDKDEPPARFAQFTSSGVKNVWPEPVMVLARGFGLAQGLERALNPLERLAWKDDDPDVLTVPAGVALLPPAQAKLRAEPVLLPTHGWPDGTKVARPPDWSWRFRMLKDPRPIAGLPEPAKPSALDEADPAKDVAVSISGYRAVARRHARQLERVSFTRQVLFESNIGVITFSDADGRLTVVQELHARPPQATKAEVYARHAVVLSRATTDPAEPRPTIGAAS